MKAAGAAEDAPPGTPNPFLNSGKKGPKQMAIGGIIKGKGIQGKGAIVKPGGAKPAEGAASTGQSAPGAKKDEKKPKVE